MKVALLALLALGCAADPVLLPDSGPCSSACGAGTVCQGGACVAVDAGTVDAPRDNEAGVVVDIGVDRPAVVDLGPTMDAPIAAADAGVDSGAVDTGSDAGVDVDPRQSEVCRGVTATCDGRIVNVQGGSRDGGIFYHCGGCGITCASGEFCINCVCQR